MNDCAICDKRLADGSKLVTLGEKGCEGIARISAACNDSIHIKIGQQVHMVCRRDYIRDGGRRKRKSTDDTHLSLRSDKAAFCYKEHCLYCEHGDRYKGKIKHHVLIPVRTIDFQDTVRKLCVDRADNWAETFLSRIAFVPDLHAADSMYHSSCDVSFRTGKQIPECFQSDSNSSTKRRRSGRPVVTDREEAFLIVADRFEANDEEVTTVHDLITQMKNILHNSESEPYGLTYMNGKLKEHFGDRIIITEINGKKNVVTFLQTASSIVSDFHHHPKETDPEAEKLRLIETAVKLIKTDIKTIVQSRDVYPTTLEMASVEMTLAFLPVSLRHFLDCLFVGKDRVSSIGQSIMQAARPRVLTAPLQLGLGVQMHSLFASRFLVDTLYRHGFCSSYSEIQKFERSAATQSGTDIPGYIPGHFIQYAADNVDHNIRTLDGSGTFHGMGIVANVTPKVGCASVIKRVSVTANDIAQVGKIDIRHYTAPTLGLKTLEYNTIVLPEIHSLEKILNVDLLWKTTFAVRPQRPDWSGFMQLISRGEHPGASSVRLLPMIDMDPGDLTCIYSTLCFVLDHSRRYNVTPVITFDQPLWWKATSILENERERSELKSIVVRLGGFHTLMCYLGCIGHLMEGSGLKETMEHVFTRNTVTYIMSGKAVSRALRGHFLVDAALHTILLEDALDFKRKSSSKLKPVKTNGEGDGTEGSCEVESVLDITDSSENVHVTESVKEDEDIPDVMKNIATMLDHVIKGDMSLENIASSPTLKTLQSLLSDATDTPKEKINICQLWTLYMKMVDIIRSFLRSERTGDWDLHLQALYDMLPYLAASGHNLYTKSLQIYLQKMCKLQDTHGELYHHFKQGLHGVRRSDRY